MDDPTVVVIGGGATGVGVARDLAMRNVSVTLCERGGLGGATTGHSHGLLHSGARYATTDPASAAACHRERTVLSEIAGAAVQETGGLFVQLPDDDPDEFGARLGACAEQGIPTAVRDIDAVREEVPALSPTAEQAFAVPDGVIYPARLVAATAESARRHGAKIRTGSPIRGIRRSGGRVVAVELDTGTVEADHVVNAAGAWAGRVATLAGLEVRMAPTAGAMVVVRLPGVSRVLNRCRPPDDGDIVVPYDDRVVVGTTSVAVDDPEASPKDVRAVETLLDAGAELLPSIPAAPVEATYWGVRPIVARPDDDGGRTATREFFVYDHARDGLEGMTTITGGKLTTHRAMAETASDAVCASLGVTANSHTADEPLPADDLDELATLIDTYDVGGPVDDAAHVDRRSG